MNVPTIDKNWNIKNLTAQQVAMMKVEAIIIKVNNPEFTPEQVAEKLIKKFKIKRLK